MISLQPNGQVRMQTDIRFPVSIEQAWQTVSQVESFACIDFFHRKVSHLDRAYKPLGRILIDHRFLGARIIRKGRVFGWREGYGYGFSDLSCRNKRRGFPHVYLFRLRREGKDRCSLRIEINGRWTARWIPRPLVVLWLLLIFTKIAASAERSVLMDALREMSHSGSPVPLGN